MSSSPYLLSANFLSWRKDLRNLESAICFWSGPLGRGVPLCVSVMGFCGLFHSSPAPPSGQRSFVFNNLTALFLHFSIVVANSKSLNLQSAFGRAPRAVVCLYVSVTGFCGLFRSSPGPPSEQRSFVFNSLTALFLHFSTVLALCPRFGNHPRLFGFLGAILCETLLYDFINQLSRVRMTASKKGCGEPPGGNTQTS
jgi:hypothetical protein